MRRAESEPRLLLTIMQEIAAAEDFRSALTIALRRVCETTGWAYGEIWFPRSDGTALVHSATWSHSSEMLDGFRKLSKVFTFAPGAGLPGRVWLSKAPEWIQDMSVEAQDQYPRCKLAKDFGLKAVLGIPVIAINKTVAVLVFFMFESRQEDKRLVELVSSVAAQLGSFFQRKLAEEELRKARDELEIRVQDRTAELRRANAALVAEIAERQQAEETARRQEGWLRGLIDTTQDAVVYIDRQGRVVLFNPSAERIFGYTQSEIQGQNVNLLMPEPNANEHTGDIIRSELTGERHATGGIRTLEARRKNGEIFPVEISVTEVTDEKTEEIRYAAFIRDISEKVRLQEQLIEHGRLAAIGMMAAKIAHQIGNPLNGMSLTVQHLERQLATQGMSSPAMVDSNLRRLKDEIGRLTRLLDDFRSVSRRDRYHFQPTVVPFVIRELLAMETEKYIERGVDIQQFIPADLPLVNADRDKLRQALSNLCNNAVEAMPQGGTLTLRAHSSAADVVLEIKDTGVGINPGTNIFEPLTITKQSGTGLGLVVVRQIIAAHGGSLSYTSEPGKGTTFRVALPKAP